MEALYRRLKAAAAAGESISIIYPKGTARGEECSVSPVHVVNGKMIAREHDSGELRDFHLDQVRLAGEAGRHRVDEHRSTLGEASNGDVAELERLGWRVEVSKRAIVLYRRRGKGEPRDDPEVGIIEYAGGPGAPFHVFGPGLVSSRSFQELSSAIRLFAEEAVNHAPGNKGSAE